MITPGPATGQVAVAIWVQLQLMSPALLAVQPLEPSSSPPGGGGGGGGAWWWSCIKTSDIFNPFFNKNYKYPN